MKTLELILASGSPRRRQLLKGLDLQFSVLVTDADETIRPDWTPTLAVRHLARRKALAAAQMSPEESRQTMAIIAADTVVSIDGVILGKPIDAGDAIATLRRLVGRPHEVYTGVCLYLPMNEYIAVDAVCTSVTMRDRDEAWLKWYVSTGEPMDKAGSYAIQGYGSLLIDEIKGDYYNVVGLPINRLDDMLERVGLSLRSFMRQEQLQ